MKDWKDPDLSSMFLTGIRGAIPLAETQLEIISRLVHGFLAGVKTFLDLGCGDGILGRYIHDQYPEAHGYYLDYSEHMISELKKKLKHCCPKRFLS
jgi:tRNA (cmo5U34)-methyltransferase